MLMAYFAIEAYANFLLDVMDPALFAAEKEKFGGGLEGKIEWAYGLAGLKLDKGKRPYQTLSALTELRQRVVHAKPNRYEKRLEGVDPDALPMFEPGELERRVTPAEWRRALDAVSEICEALRGPIYERADANQRLRLQNSALEGSTQIQTVRTSVQPFEPGRVQKGRLAMPNSEPATDPVSVTKPKRAWLLLAGVALIGAYAAMFIPTLAGNRVDPASGQSSLIFSIIFFSLWWKRRGRKAWHGAVLGAIVGLVAFFIAGFIGGYVGHGH